MRPITALARRTALRSCVLAAALRLLLIPVDALGAVPAAQPLRGGDWALTLNVDNDWFAGTDRSYTGGLRPVAAQVDRHPLPTPLAEACERPSAGRPLALDVQCLERLLLPRPLWAEPGSTRQSFGLGLGVFTPDDTHAVHPPAGQRPYGGSTYLLYGLEQDFDARRNGGSPGGRFLLGDRFASDLEVQAG